MHTGLGAHAHLAAVDLSHLLNDLTERWHNVEPIGEGLVRPWADQRKTPFHVGLGEPVILFKRCGRAGVSGRKPAR